MGYYVAFLTGMGKNVVLPASWIKNIGSHYAKFINNSLNHVQKYDCFYPEASSRAFINKCPDENFEPDFNSINCHKGKLKRYFGM